VHLRPLEIFVVVFVLNLIFGKQGTGDGREDMAVQTAKELEVYKLAYANAMEIVEVTTDRF
jgi:hypothetical protein